MTGLKERSSAVESEAQSRNGIYAVLIVLLLIASSSGFLSFYFVNLSLAPTITGIRISDFMLFVIWSHPILFGLFLASDIVIGYFTLYEVALVLWKGRMKALEYRILNLTETGKDSLINISRRAREKSMIDMGSLFIPTAFVLLGAAATAQGISRSARIALALSAPALYVMWLFLVQLTTRLMDDVDSQMKLFADDTTTDILHRFYGDRHGIGYMTRLRRNHWLAYIPLLTLGATLIIQAIITGTP